MDPDPLEALADAGRQVDFEAARKAVSETWPTD